MNYPSESILLNMHPQEAMSFSINSNALISNSCQWTWQKLSEPLIPWKFGHANIEECLLMLGWWWHMVCLCALGYPGTAERGAVAMTLYWCHTANLWWGWLATKFLCFTPRCSHVFILLGLERLNGSQIQDMKAVWAGTWVFLQLCWQASVNADSVS